MLKIKDTVDLKELEKFGFEEEPLAYIKRKRVGAYCIYKTIVNKTSREITIETAYAEVIIELTALFDLFQAGLVEKVEE